MEEWKEYKLGEVGKITTGKTPKTAIKEYFDGNIFFVTPADINTPYKYVPETARYLSEEGLNSISSNSIDKGSICVSCIGNIGYVGIVNMKCASNQQINSITVNQEHDRDFVYYAIKNLWSYFKNFEGQSTTLSILNKGQFSKIVIKMPQKEIQQKIASILSSLDDKIELNRRINENLEQQAQALFKSWFVDFEPFKNGEFVESELGMIPKGWRAGTLTKIAEYLNGLAMQKFPPLSDDDAIPVLKIKELGQSQCDNSSDKCSKQIKPEYIVKNGDVVFSWSGTLMVDIWCGGICGLNQHLFKVTSDNYPKWFYLMWTEHHLAEFIRIAKDKAVTMGHIKRGDLEKAQVTIPDSNTLDKMSEVMNDIFDQIINTRLEINTLSTLRDTLLPRLMSGELKVNEIEKSL